MRDRVDVSAAVPADLEGLYDVCLRTGASGADASDLHADPTLLGKVYVGPYVVVDGTVASTVRHGNVISGYVLGAVDTTAFEAACERTWWPALRAQYPRNAAGYTTADRDVIGRLHDPPIAERELVEAFPSHMHIDLLPILQGQGLGRVLIEQLFDQLRQRGSHGIHLGVGVDNERAIGFYRWIGFSDAFLRDDELVMVASLVD